MDERGWGENRANPLPKLPQSAARGSLQVLRSPLRGCVSEAHRETQRNDRGAGAGINGTLDLTARCETCGCHLPEKTASGRRKRWNAKYCSDRCRGRSTIQLDQEARREGLAGRSCNLCGDPISDDRRSDAIYCSKRCQTGARMERSRRRLPGTCKQCGIAYFACSPAQTFCSHECRGKASRLAEVRCEWCKKVFQPAKRSRRFCSRSCGNNGKGGRSSCHPTLTPRDPLKSQAVSSPG